MPAARSTPSVLRRLFEAAGFRWADRPAGLLAFRSRDRRAVLLVRGFPGIAEIEREFPIEAFHRTLVYSEPPPSATREDAARHGLEVLDSDSLGPALGELLLPAPDFGSAVHASLDTGPVDAPPVLFPEGVRTVLPRLGSDDARIIAGVENAPYWLRLIPFYVAPYRVRTVAAAGAPSGVSDHVVAVNALSGRVEVWEGSDRELVSALDGPFQEFVPQISEAEARRLAEETVRRRHAVEVDTVEQHGGAVVIETRRVPAGSEDLRLGPTVLVRVPYWYVEGPRGRVVVDAVTGARVSGDPRVGAE